MEIINIIILLLIFKLVRSGLDGIFSSIGFISKGLGFLLGPIVIILIIFLLLT
jgi:hypothetical protein